MRYVKYLAYGSNLHPERIRRRVASVTLLGIAVLTGWSLRFHKLSRDGSGKCNLIQNSDDSAYGAIYEFPLHDKSTLDELEGLGTGYEERRLVLDGFGEVYFYAAAEEHIDDGLKPYEWYKAFVLGGLKYHQMPDAYIRAVETILPIRDHDAARVRSNREILDAFAEK